MTRRLILVGAPAWGVVLALGCARSAAPGDRAGDGANAAGRSGSEPRRDLDAHSADAVAAARDAGSRDDLAAGAGAEAGQPPPAPARRATHAKPQRWPKPAQVTGTELQLAGLPQMRGITR